MPTLFVDPSTAASVVSRPSARSLPLMPEEALLALRCHSPSPALEDEIFRRFRPLALAMVARYSRGDENHEDLVQVANLALISALRRFDVSRGIPFAAFATPTILGELRRHFRDRTWRLHVPRSLQDRSLRIDSVVRDLTNELGKAPSVNELAQRSGLSEEEIVEVAQVKASQKSVSCDMPSRADDGGSPTILESVGHLDAGYEAVEAQMTVCCANLTEQELTVIRLRFTEELDQLEIASRLGVSQMQVSRVLRTALAKLLEAVQGDESPDGKRTFEDVPDARFPKGRFRIRKPVES